MTALSRELSCAVWALSLGMIAVFVVVAVPLPIWYAPMDGVFVLGDKPAGVVIDYYGRVLVVVVATLAGAGLGAFVRTRAKLVSLSLAWAALAAALSVGLWLSQIWNRSITPIRIPAIEKVAP
ncbi:MAG TPA: hypothetical protein VGO62_00970 [Myxococcota bacterium]